MKRFEKVFPILVIAGILLNFNGLLYDILEPDGALYASIAKHMALSGNWTDLFGEGHDWLDKPHFPFWVTALSFRILGITAFAYKLPAFVFWLMGICYTYKLAEKLYNAETAKVAAVIYIFSLHGLLNNFDVRAEPYLTALSIAAIYYFYIAYTSGRLLPIIATAFFAACAVMTKGIFVLITIGAGFVIYWMISGQWKQFLNYRWWLMIFLIAVFITPELYCLYTQFDLHPEKVVFGRTGVSGLKFFFWDSQFGRFFNTGPIKGHGDKTFFLHTTLWAFLPWSLLFYAAVYNLFRNRKNEGNKAVKWIIYGSAAVTFLLFSFSGFQLPYYIVILFPQFSIITASYLVSIANEKTIKKWSVTQTVLLALAVVIVCFLAFYMKLPGQWWVLSMSVILLTIVLLTCNNTSKESILIKGVGLSAILFVFLFNFFYPSLLPYQAGMQAGKWVERNSSKSSAALFKSWSFTYEFYAPGFVATLRDYNDLDTFLITNQKNSIYTTQQTLSELKQNGYDYKLLEQFPYFHISMLTGEFLNPETRNQVTEKMFLIGDVRKK